MSFNKSIRFLDIGRNYTIPEGICKSIEDMFTLNSTITHFNIEWCNLDANKFPYLVKIATNLSHLKISGNRLKISGDRRSQIGVDDYYPFGRREDNFRERSPFDCQGCGLCPFNFPYKGLRFSLKYFDYEYTGYNNTMGEIIKWKYSFEIDSWLSSFSLSN